MFHDKFNPFRTSKKVVFIMYQTQNDKINVKNRLTLSNANVPFVPSEMIKTPPDKREKQCSKSPTTKFIFEVNS